MNYISGEPVSTGNILAAEFINRGHQYRTLISIGDQSNYFSPDGKHAQGFSALAY
jgi:hypothetical protein